MKKVVDKAIGSEVAQKNHWEVISHDYFSSPSSKQPSSDFRTDLPLSLYGHESPLSEGSSLAYLGRDSGFHRCPHLCSSGVGGRSHLGYGPSDGFLCRYLPRHPNLEKEFFSSFRFLVSKLNLAQAVVGSYFFPQPLFI